MKDPTLSEEAEAQLDVLRDRLSGIMEPEQASAITETIMAIVVAERDNAIGYVREIEIDYALAPLKKALKEHYHQDGKVLGELNL